MSLENPVAGDSAEKSKKKKIAIVDISSSAEDKARDVADAKMTASKESLAGPRLFRGEKRTSLEQLGGMKNVFQKIWKHNLFREYYRQKEIVLARKKISESGNLFVDETVHQEAHNEAMGAIVEQFTSEFEETIHAEAGEKKENLGESEPEKNIKVGIKKLIADYASGIINNEEAFREEKNRILSQVTEAKKGVIDKGSMYADNLLEVAKQVKESIEHGAKLEELDLDFEVVVGQAKLGARTEAQYNAVDRIVQKIESSKAGRFFNEATVTSAVAIAYSLSAGLSQRIARSRLAAWGSFGATAVLGAGIAGMREGKKLEDERRQHSRETAQGKKFDPEKSPRRKEMEEYRYESKNATDLTDALNQSLYEYGNGERKTKKLDQSQLDIVLGNLTEIESRIALSDRSKIDLINYSRSEKLESERLQLDIARGQAKTEIKKILSSDSSLKISGGATLEECLKALKETKIETFISGDKGIEAKNRMFRKMKIKNVAKAAVKGLGYGLLAGSIFQEAAALLRDNQEGIFEYGSEAKGPSGQMNYTPLEYIRRLALGEFPRINPGTMHEMILGSQHLQLPENVNLAKAADGTYKFLRGDDVLAENIKFDSNGSLTADSWRALEDLGVKLRTDIVEHVSGSSGAAEASGVAETPGALIEEHKELFQKIKRDFWYDNDTPKPVFDKNELKLWWGGLKNSGMDANGNYVFNIKQMLPDGSYHGKFAVDAQEAFKEGKMKMLLSLSRDTQGSVVEVSIDANGNAIIDPKSDIGKMFFEMDSQGHAVFKGKFAEVAEMMEQKDGADHARILATHEGIDNTTPAPIGEKVPHTVFDFPEEYTVDPPPFIPIFGRDPLEPTKNFVPYVEGYFQDNSRNKSLYEKRRSRKLEDPNVKLDHFEETDDYFKRQSKEYMKEIEELAKQISNPINKECDISVCIPAAGHQEGKNIYKTLESYKDQQNRDGSEFDPKKFEILVFVNHPNDKDPDQTLDEIKRFQSDNPDIPVRMVYKKFERKDAKIGNIRKYATDVALWRHHQRGREAKDLIFVSNDADCKEMSQKYLSNFIDQFKAKPEIDAVLGKVDWDPEAYVKSPLIHLGTRIFQYLDIILRHNRGKDKKAIGSSGANFAFKSSIYAAIGGYLEEDSIAEDKHLGEMIKFSRAKAFNYPIEFGGHNSFIITSARRAIAAVQKGWAPVEQWGTDFGPDDELRTMEFNINEGNIKELLDSKEYEEKLKAGMQRFLIRTFRLYGIKANSWEAKRVIGFMGMKYKIQGEEIIITDASKMIKNLKKYQENRLG